jgi:hypothetical protein
MTKRKKQVLKKFYMAGTEDTGQYIVVALTQRGRIGVRLLNGSSAKSMAAAKCARIRIEPTHINNAAATMAKKLPQKLWKQPGQNGQNRFSIEVHGGGKKLKRKVRDGLKALGIEDGLKVTMNPIAPKWAQKLVAGMMPNAIVPNAEPGQKLITHTASAN